ncbi:hypothetical protein ACTJKQ_12650 [Acidovorax sp. 22279]|uniref:hypothetical protein n=1 Tax=Acidovorax sp. 22279 TaxID=3453900 RepID=UPI003F8640B0
MILNSDLDSEEKWVIQRRVYRRGEKCSWRTISPPINYGEAVSELFKFPAETTRLMTGIEEYFPINSIQREI